MTVKGNCLCGKVQYQAENCSDITMNCHCRMCQQFGGAPFMSFAMAPLSDFKWTQGAALVSQYNSSPGFFRTFCQHCGSALPVADETLGSIYLPANSLDIAAELKVGGHMFVKSKMPWDVIADDAPQFDELPSHA